MSNHTCCWSFYVIKLIICGNDVWHLATLSRWRYPKKASPLLVIDQFLSPPLEFHVSCTIFFKYFWVIIIIFEISSLGISPDHSIFHSCLPHKRHMLGLCLCLHLNFTFFSTFPKVPHLILLSPSLSVSNIKIFSNNFIYDDMY